MKEVFCDNNLLTELNVNGLLSLESLKCEGNNLLSLDVSGVSGSYVFITAGTIVYRGLKQAGMSYLRRCIAIIII